MLVSSPPGDRELDVLERVQFQRVGRRDPEVAATSPAARPQQVGVAVLGGPYNLRRSCAVGHHDLGGEQVVGGQSQVAGEQSEPAAENHTAEADASLRAGRNDKAALPERRDCLLLREPRPDHRRARRLVDRDALHPTDVDNQAAVERGPAIEAVAPAACPQGDALLASPFDRVDHVLRDVAEHDCLGIARVQAVPADPRRLVAGIAGSHYLTRQLDSHQITASVSAEDFEGSVSSTSGLQTSRYAKYTPPARSKPTTIRTGMSASAGDTRTNNAKRHHTSAPIATGSS